MGSALPFVALWSEVRTTGEVDLHLLNREMHHTVPIPEIGSISKTVEAFLPELSRFMPARDHNSRWLLLLEPNLPAAWFAIRWESLNLAGRPLWSQALVVRHAVWVDQSQREGNPAWLLNLFPTYEYSFLERFQPLIQSGDLRTCRKNSLERTAGTNDIFFMAHGRTYGLVDANDALFVLPDMHPAPRRVWLLACNVDAAIDALAKNLLSAGCESVIAATSELSAPAMARLVEDWFQTGREAGSLASWLALKGDTGQGDGDVRTLTIWGGIDFDQTPSAKWNRLTWTDLHGEFCQSHLDDETTRESFHEAFQQGRSPEAWPITRKWMTPQLLWLAEKHHHPAMAELSEEIGDTSSPEAIRSLAAAARRVGNYVQTAKYLSLGLNLPDLPIKERADYLGALANLFIDLDLPENAAVAIELHEDCSLDDPKDRNEADFKRLDWRARIEARRGRLDIALDHMTAKRKRVTPDTGRELAWQLYLASWGYVANQVSKAVATEFAGEVKRQLENVQAQDIGYGNETISYLLRALATYAWATEDADSQRIAADWLAVAEHRLTDDDPGPWAYIVAYLHLQQRAPSASFDRAMGAMEHARYHLEATILMGMCGRESASRKILARFQRRRSDIVLALNLAQAAQFSDLKVESTLREKIENESQYRLDVVARSGILPL
jgi:hypothetical protein